MKRFIPVIILLLLVISISNVKGQKNLIIKDNNYSVLSLENHIPDYQVKTIKTNGGEFAVIDIAGYGSSNTVGYPQLPAIKELIEIPFGAECSVQVINYDMYEISLSSLGSDLQILPYQASVSKSANPDDIVFQINNKVYSTNQYIENELASIEIIGNMRGSRVARLEIAPFDYNPVTNTLRVYQNMEIVVSFNNSDVSLTDENRSKFYSPMFESSLANLINHQKNSTKDTLSSYPIKYVIVSDRDYQSQIQDLIQWKTDKGFIVVEAYTDMANVGGTTTSIKSYLQGLYNAATPSDPAPTYVLFVGDEGDIPAFNGTTATHPSDFYYSEYTNDWLPEVYIGRFPASDTTDCRVLVEKTIEYEKYLMPSGAHLAKSILVAGDDATYGPTHANGQVNYANTMYVNATNNVTASVYLYPAASSQSATIRNDISEGAAIANYTAHCSSSGWGGPSFTTSNIPALANDHKYPLIISNCCLSSDFDNGSDCFAEAIVVAENKGAVAHIGASNSSYWNEDFYYTVGYRANITANPSYDANNKAVFDLWWHTHNEAYSEWCITPAQINVFGNMSVTTSNSSSYDYYWEMYTVMGDPSLLVYQFVPTVLTATYSSTALIGTNSFNVTTDPYAYVGLTISGVYLGSALADASGNAVVSFPALSTGGVIDIVITAQNKQPHFGSINLVSPTGPYIVKQTITIDDAAANNNGEADYNEAILLDAVLENVGVADANAVDVTISTTNTNITITDNNENFGNIAQSATATRNDAFGLSISNSITDQEMVQLNLNITDNASNLWTDMYTFTVNAPNVMCINNVNVDDNTASGNNNSSLDPGETVNLLIPIKNIGHADISTVLSTLTVTNFNITITNPTNTIPLIAINGTQYAQFEIIADANAPVGSSANFELISGDGIYMDTMYFTLAVGIVSEDWETGDFTKFLWTNGGNTDWTIVNTDPYEGTECAQSGAISNNQTSELIITLNIGAPDSISFMRKVDCEESWYGTKWDYLGFYIDGNEMDWWDGSKPWERQAYYVNTGIHTFKWKYEKDNTQSGGSDAAWIDYIIFPPLYDSTASINDIVTNNDNSFNCYPNPAIDYTYVNYDLDIAGEAVIEIYNNAGVMIDLYKFYVNIGKGSKKINTFAYKGGIYHVNMKIGQSSYASSFIVTN